jgi:hypothetical protein
MWLGSTQMLVIASKDARRSASGNPFWATVCPGGVDGSSFNARSAAGRDLVGMARDVQELKWLEVRANLKTRSR